MLTLLLCPQSDWLACFAPRASSSPPLTICSARHLLAAISPDKREQSGCIRAVVASTIDAGEALVKGIWVVEELLLRLHLLIADSRRVRLLLLSVPPALALPVKFLIGLLVLLLFEMLLASHRGSMHRASTLATTRSPGRWRRLHEWLVAAKQLRRRLAGWRRAVVVASRTRMKRRKHTRGGGVILLGEVTDAEAFRRLWRPSAPELSRWQPFAAASCSSTATETTTTFASSANANATRLAAARRTGVAASGLRLRLRHATLPPGLGERERGGACAWWLDLSLTLVLSVHRTEHVIQRWPSG